MYLRLIIIAIVIATSAFTISSPEFKDRGEIPKRCTCQGGNYNPEIEITDLPKATKTMVLIMDDPDVIVNRSSYIHWLVWDISPTKFIEENSNPGVSGRNSAGTYGYTGPCPTSGVHRYYITIYALNTELHLDKNSDRITIEKAMEGHIIDKSELMGYYEKSDPFLLFY